MPTRIVNYRKKQFARSKVIFSAETIFPSLFGTEGKWLIGKEPKCQLVI